MVIALRSDNADILQHFELVRMYLKALNYHSDFTPISGVMYLVTKKVGEYL